MHLFATQGYDGSLQKVADDVGLHKATLYNYFDCKDELYLTILRNETNSIVQEVEKTVTDNAGASLKTALFAIVKTIIQETPTDRLLLLKRTQLMIVSSQNDLCNSAREVMRGFDHKMQSIVMDLLVSNNVEINTNMLFMQSYFIFVMGILELTLHNAVYKVQGDSDKAIHELWEGFWSVGGKLV